MLCISRCYLAMDLNKMYNIYQHEAKESLKASYEEKKQKQERALESLSLRNSEMQEGYKRRVGAFISKVIADNQKTPRGSSYSPVNNFSERTSLRHSSSTRTALKQPMIRVKNMVVPPPKQSVMSRFREGKR